MNIPADSRLRLLASLVELARKLPPSTLNALISALESGDNTESLERFAVTAAMKEKLRRLEDLCGLQSSIDCQGIAFALRAAAEAASAIEVDHRTEIAWTGPATDAVPLRRVDQLIYDMVESARGEVLLVTYAAYKAERAMQALRRATDRNVRVKLVLELAQESGGKISFDGLPAFRALVPSAQVFYWPLNRRQRSESGAYGTMHAKCLVADRSRAIVSSANFTDHALQMNMELGVLIEGRMASRLAEHFDQLTVRGELIAAP